MHSVWCLGGSVVLGGFDMRVDRYVILSNV